MLVKHPALSLVAGFGIAVAVTIGATGFGYIRTLTASDLPLDEGDRVVRVLNTRGGLDAAPETHLHDLDVWRTEVPALAEVGAYRIVTRNLMTDDGLITPASVVEMSASGFGVARVPPLLGRPLVGADGREDAQSVVVIGHGMWQDRFGGETDVIGRTIQIGATDHTIVGVMPEGFLFPVRNRIWTPLRLDPLDYGRGAAPPIEVFGRLAPGARVEDARAQLAVLGARAAALYPETHESLVPGVFPYTQALLWGWRAWLVYLAQVGLTLVLMVIAIDVGALVYARTVTRTSEIVVRTALGASRARIATQLFVEALVLCSAAALLGLLAAHELLQRIGTSELEARGEGAAFWLDFGLTPATVAYAFGFAAVAAIVVGVFPALGATGRRLRRGLQGAAAGGSGPVLGRTWTLLIVLQVSAAVAVLPAAINAGGQLIYASRPGPAFATDELVWASPELEPEALRGSGSEAGPDRAARSREMQSALLARLSAEPWVADVVTMRPAPWQDPDLTTEIQWVASSSVDGRSELSLPSSVTAGWSRVSPNFFEAFGVPIAVGRAFEAREAAMAEPVVVVSRMFAERYLRGGDPLGVRIRPARQGGGGWDLGAGGVWYTIVGVVPDMRRAVTPLAMEPKVYQPLPPGEHDRMSFAVRVLDGDVRSRINRLRAVALEVDPMLQLQRLTPVGEMFRRGETGARTMTLGIVTIALSVLLLSVAGLYALMSFTVARRHREIGIRSALGARPGGILRGILARAALQVAVGVAAGLALAGLLDRIMQGLTLSGREGLILPSVAVLMAVVGLLAAWGPARRGLRIQPTEALRAE